MDRTGAVRVMLARVAETHFDEWIAKRYDALWPELLDPSLLDSAVDVLTDLVGEGAALEFGIGTGRLAMPLSQRGVRVHGIELSHHYWAIDGELRTFSSPHRYLWPSELDLMARLAGMTLHSRWGNWNREPFTSESRSHVSVWLKT